MRPKMPFRRIRELFLPNAEAMRRARVAAASGTSKLAHALETSRLVAWSILVATVAALLLISFTGTTPAALHLLPGQVSGMRIVASSPFSYESGLSSQRLAEHERDRVPPVYRLDPAPAQRFLEALGRLQVDFELFVTEQPNLGEFQAGQRLRRLLSAFNESGPYHIVEADLLPLQTLADPRSRQAAWEAGRRVLSELLEAGVHALDAGDGSAAVFVTTGRSPGRNATYSLERAMIALRSNLAGEGWPPDVTQSLYRIFRQGLVPNLIFDAEATQQARRVAVQALKPAVKRVQRNETIIESGVPVSPEQHEMLAAYRRHLLDTNSLSEDTDRLFLPRILQVLAMVLAAGFYLRLEDRRTLQSNSRLSLVVLLALLNLAAVRATVALGQTEYFLENPAASALLAYCAPVAFAPLCIAILVGPGPGIFMGLLVAFFTGVIHGNRIDIMAGAFLASLVAVYGCRTLRVRARVVRAGVLSGFAGAGYGGLLGLALGAPGETVAVQAMAAFLNGVFTAVAVVGLLPVFESLFKVTTDITLLELTDSDHPLLRRMQLEAPGSYHHSLIVASLAENAASAIGANALLTRVCALYHDIGKLEKPEYFTENQRSGVNPHDQKNPSMSALIIKSHVKEGVALGLKHRLPRPVLDVIRQHHGTTLMQFFFTRARERVSRAARDGYVRQSRPEADAAESVYRYDGPKPQFKECAIIHIADSVEAASRSLRKITPQSIAELVESLVESRIGDGQLDECPLTLEEVAKVKSSFTFTLLNMLHNRTPYPAGDGAGQEEPPAAAPAAE